MQFSAINSALLTISVLFIVLGFMYGTIKLIIYYYIPKEMKSPIPISELIYSITMLVPVAYILIRFFPFLPEQVLHVLALTGAMIALFSSFIALTQYNLIRILTYCSISHFGYILCAIGVGSFFAGFFHLITYIIFISCLFISFSPMIKRIQKNQKNKGD